MLHSGFILTLLQKSGMLYISSFEKGLSALENNSKVNKVIPTPCCAFPAYPIALKTLSWNQGNKTAFF